MKLRVNQDEYDIDADPQMPLLWVLRDELGLPGTKFGCGMGLCGACTVHHDGQAVRACSFPVGSVTGTITTIEGLGTPNAMHLVQQAWLDHQVAQCGYCQPGQVMSAAALLASNPAPTDEQIDQALSGNLCRCGTYPKIRAAVQDAARRIRQAQAEDKQDPQQGSRT